MLNIPKNSFITVLEAEEILVSFYTPSELSMWDTLDEGETTLREIYLRKAHKAIIGAYRYVADLEILTPDEFNLFFDETMVEAFKEAQAHQALYILTNQNQADMMRKRGITSAAIGSSSMSVKDEDRFKLCPEAYELVSRYILIPRIIGV